MSLRIHPHHCRRIVHRPILALSRDWLRRGGEGPGAGPGEWRTVFTPASLAAPRTPGSVGGESRGRGSGRGGIGQRGCPARARPTACRTDGWHAAYARPPRPLQARGRGVAQTARPPTGGVDGPTAPLMITGPCMLSAVIRQRRRRPSFVSVTTMSARSLASSGVGSQRRVAFHVKHAYGHASRRIACSSAWMSTAGRVTVLGGVHNGPHTQRPHARPQPPHPRTEPAGGIAPTDGLRRRARAQWPPQAACAGPQPFAAGAPRPAISAAASR